MERNTYINTIFIQYSKAIYTRVDDIKNTNNDAVECPAHTYVINTSMRYKNKNSAPFNRKMFNRLLDECGDASIKNSNNSFVEPALKNFDAASELVRWEINIRERIEKNLKDRGVSDYNMYLQEGKKVEYYF